MTIDLAAAPVSWGVDYAEAPGNPPWSVVLDGIAAAGYRHVELGPVGYLPEDAAELSRALRQRGLALVAGFVFAHLHDPAAEVAAVRTARRACALVAAAGGTHLVIIDHPSERPGGHTIAAVRTVAGIAREHGLVPAVHLHAGTTIATVDELMRVLDRVPEASACVDTGHALLAGADPAQLVRALGDRVVMLHLKDVVTGTLSPGQPFGAAVEAGVFCPVGEGRLDVAGLGAALGNVGFSGPATVEQDPAAGAADPVGDARRSLRYLRRHLDAGGRA